MVVSSSAQIQWTSNHEPSLGNSRDFYLIDSNAVDLASVKGNNVTWDYSSVFAYSSNLKKVHIEDATTSQYAIYFSGAVHRATYLNKFQDFYSVSSSEKLVYGMVFNEPSLGDLFFHHHPHVSRTYPWQLNSSASGALVNASIVVTQPQIQGHPSQGSFEVECDGVGTLKVGDSSVQDVMRTYYYDSSRADLGALGPLDVVRVQYEYNKPGNAFPLFLHSTIHVRSQLYSTDYALVVSQIAPGVIYGIEENELKIGKKLYPNPVDRELNIEFEQNVRVDRVVIFNSIGRLSKVIEPLRYTSFISLNTDDLKAGLYSVRIYTDRGIANGRFIRQ